LERERGGSVRESARETYLRSERDGHREALREFVSSRSMLERVLAERAVTPSEAFRPAPDSALPASPSVAVAGLLGASAATLAPSGAQGHVPAYGRGGVVAEIPDLRWHGRD